MSDRIGRQASIYMHFYELSLLPVQSLVQHFNFLLADDLMHGN